MLNAPLRLADFLCKIAPRFCRPTSNVCVLAAAELETSKASSREHCSLDPQTLKKVGGVKRQILLNRHAGGLYALYTVTDDYNIWQAPFWAEPRWKFWQHAHCRLPWWRAAVCRLGPEGLRRLQAGIEDIFDAVADTTIIRPGEFFEDLSIGANYGLAILAPHGGDIEPGTDDQAKLLEGELLNLGKHVSRWTCDGQKKAGDPPKAAYERWHITSADISEHSFPKLERLFKFKFDYAVAFHGWEDRGVGIGGGASQSLKERIRDEIRSRSLHNIDVAHIYVVQSGSFSGNNAKNIVNRITKTGTNGIQIEQSTEARKAGNKEKIVSAVADVLKNLI